MKRLKGIMGKTGLIILSLILMATLGAGVLAPTPVEAATYTYNRQAAVNYALRWWNNTNPAYVNFRSNDCTNFVSQCLLAGSWSETGKYQYLSLSAWYYDWGWQPGFSNTWTKATDFSQFLSKRASPYSLAHKPWSNYFRARDIVQIDYEKNGTWDHTMIITSVGSSDMYVTYHWANGPYVSLTQLLNKYPNAQFMGYRLYDQFSQ